MAASMYDNAPLPKRGRPAYSQKTILEGAVTLFNEHGYDATSMDLLAKHLGISKSAIYYHVKSKEQLLSLALDVALGSLEAVLTRIERFTGNPEEQLRYAIRGSIEVICRELEFVTLLLRVRGNTPTELAARERRREFDHRLSKVIVGASKTGVIDRDFDPLLVSRLVFGMINSLVEWYDPRGDCSAADLADTVTAILLQKPLKRPASLPEGN